MIFVIWGRLLYCSSQLFQLNKLIIHLSIWIDFSRFCFNFQSSIYLLKIEEDFPSCFQNMTRLTNLSLERVRGENPQPISFPIQFCNMIYLQKFCSRDNNFSGF